MKNKVAVSLVIIFLVLGFLEINPLIVPNVVSGGSTTHKEIWQVVDVTNTHGSMTTSGDIKIAVSNRTGVNIAWSLNITEYFQNITYWNAMGYTTYMEWLNGTTTLPYHWGEMDWYVTDGSLTSITWDEIKYWWDMYKDSGGGVSYKTFMGSTYMADFNFTDPTNDPDIIAYNLTQIGVPWIGNNITIKNVVIPASTTIHFVFKIVITEPGAYAFDITSPNALLEISPSNWKVGGSATVLVPDEFSTIQEAIDNANAGDTIMVSAGTYTEQLIINKNLILQGLAGAKIAAPDTRNTYTFTESTAPWQPIIFAYGGTESGGAVSGSETISVTIEGIEVDGGNKASAAPTRFAAILYRNVKPGIISNNSIYQMFPPSGTGAGPQTFGIVVYGHSNVTIQYNEIRDFSRGGIGINGDDGSQPDPYATVTGNTVFGNGLETETGWWAENGIQIGWGASGKIIGNEVRDCQVNNPSWVATGILIYNAAEGVEILNNTVADCDVGISATLSSFSLIDGNTIAGSNYDGIRLGWPADNCTVSNNIISYNWAGIGIWDASDNIIENNIIEYNSYGIYMDGDSQNNLILRNKVLNSSADGIRIEPYGGFHPSGTIIHYNNIVDSGDYGLINDGTGTVDASFNYWGNETGPYDPIFNPQGSGANLSGSIEFKPWLVEPYPPSVPVSELYVNPNFIQCWTGLNNTFTVSVRLDNVKLLYGFQFELTWDPTVVNLANASYTSLWTETLEMQHDWNNSIGIYQLALSGRGDIPSFTGNATLATLTFTILCEPVHPENVTTDLVLANTLLSRSQNLTDAEPIPHIVNNGIFNCSSILPQIMLAQSVYVVERVPSDFGVNVTVAYIVDLEAFNFTITYDPNLLVFLQDQSDIFLRGTSWGITWNNGSVFGYSTGISPTLNGTATLAKLKFRALGVVWNTVNRTASCDLVFSHTNLIRPGSTPIEHAAINGTYVYKPVPGDLNMDGRVDILDLAAVAKAFGTSIGDPGWLQKADVNCDGTINILDIVIIARNYGRENPEP